MNRNMINAFVLTLMIGFVVDLSAADSDGVEPRSALTITSKPTATPKSPAVLADTTFTAAATGTGTVTYSWDFGDGTPAATGATVVHDFSASGTFTVNLTVSDSSGATQTSSVSVAVTDSVTSPKLLITLNFKRPGNDTIFLTGVARIPPGSTLSGQAFVINIGGVIQTFTLNSIGQAKVGSNSVKVFIKPVQGELVSTFFVNLKGDFLSTLASSSNLTNRTANRDPVKVKVALTFQNISYSASVSQTFISHKGLRGITR